MSQYQMMNDKTNPTATIGLRLGLLLAGVAVLGYFLFHSEQQSIDSLPTTLEAPRGNSTYGCVELEPLPDAPSNPLVDATDQIGLKFTHEVGPLGTYYMPESVGSGGAWFDFDNDGRLDLFMVGCEKSPDANEFPAGTRTGNALFRMTENGKLIDVTEGAGLSHLGYGMGCAVGDIDNDGDGDLYVTTVGQDRMLLNLGDMKFRDITQEVGISENEWGTGVSFFDYDRDGWLDLVVANYTHDSQYGHSVACGFRQQGMVSYCGPHKFEQTVDRLYHNEGLTAETNDKTGAVPRFHDVTEAAGLSTATTYGFTVIAADLTGDKWPDILIANDAQPNRFWVNQKDGTFRDEAVIRGVAYNEAGAAQGNMGIAIGDMNRDGTLDLVVSHLSGEETVAYINDGAGNFRDHTRAMNIDQSTKRHTGWGAALIDLNHDGLLDLPLVHGLVIPCHSRFAPHGEDVFQKRQDVISDVEKYWRDYADRNRLLMLEEGIPYQDKTVERGGDFTRALGSGRALIYGDPDEDGDLDLVVTYSGSPARYYRNDFEKSGHWVRLRLYDSMRRRDAIGAKVSVISGDKTRTSAVVPCTSYLAHNDLRVHFGVGEWTHFDRIIVDWPDGPVDSCVEEFPGGVVDRDIVIERGTGVIQ